MIFVNDLQTYFNSREAIFKHVGLKYTAIYLGKTDGAEYLAFFDSDKELKLTKKQLAELQLKY